MSEFSESYHLLGDVGAATAALERSGLAGWVLPGDRQWTTIIIDGEFTGDSDDELVSVTEGVLVLFSLAEDHGWTIEIFSDGRERASSRADWTFANCVLVSGDGPTALTGLLGVDESVLGRIFIARDFEEPPTDDLDAFVAAVGLSHVEWMSGAYLRRGDDSRLQLPGVVHVKGKTRPVVTVKDGRPFMPGELNDTQTSQLVEKLLGGAAKPEGFPIHSGLVGRTTEGSSVSRPMVWSFGAEKPPPSDETFDWYRKVLPAAGFEPDVTLNWVEDPPEGVRLNPEDEFMTWRGAGFEGLVIVRGVPEMFLFCVIAIRLD